MIESHPGEYRAEYRDKESFLGFIERNPWTRSAAVRRSVADAALTHGIQSLFLGAVPASEVSLVGTDEREGLLARQFNSRQRTLLDAVAAEEMRRNSAMRVLVLEGVTTFALAMKGRYPFCLATEYLPDAAMREKFFPVPHLDATAMDVPDESFDVCVSNDVLEHVPSIDAMLSETLRVLKPGGVMLATFPFYAANDEGVVRSRIEDGEICHVLEPEYHGDPVRGEGVLVFEIPGWDIIPRARAAGFADACIVTTMSHAAGITAGDFAFIMHLYARKP